MAGNFDRNQQDVGNIIGMEHVNTRVPDQVVATDFYISGMGFTRDPYMTVGTENMWINVGGQQFHLPTGEPQVLRGHVGIVVPDLDSLSQRLDRVSGKLAKTAFAFERVDGYLSVTQPWGNVFRCYSPEGQGNGMKLGVPYIEFDVPRGTAAGIARFYEQALNAPAKVHSGVVGDWATVVVGAGQELTFRESLEPEAAYDGHHIAIYIADFAGPHDWLNERGLITEESNPYQYRFKELVDPESGQALFTIEHEVRSLTHPMYQRPLVNRNPDQSQMGYQRGRDVFYA
jgi:hypothetical protein